MKRPKPNHSFLLMSIVCVFKRLTEFILLCYRTITVVQKNQQGYISELRCSSGETLLNYCDGIFNFFCLYCSHKVCYKKFKTRNVALYNASIMVELHSDLTLNLSFEREVWDKYCLLIAFLVHSFQSFQCRGHSHFQTVTLIAFPIDFSCFKRWTLHLAHPFCQPPMEFSIALKIESVAFIDKTSSNC